MALTLRSLLEEVRQELGRNPSRSTGEQLINEAGERWVNTHGWTYLRQRTQEIQLVSGQEDYRLGVGIRSLGRVLHRPDSVWAPLNLMGFSEFTAYRERYLAGIERPFNPVVSMSWNALEGDEEPRLYLHVFPSGLNERLVVEYDGGWVPLNELDDAVDIPAPLGIHFIEWIRLYARYREFPEQYPLGVVDAFKQTSAFRDAMKVDTQHNGRMLPRLGTAGESYVAARHSPYLERYEAMRHYYERGFGR